MIEGEIYALNEQETGLVSSFEANNPVDVDNEFLIELKRLCLGNFYSRSVYIQKIRIGSPRSENQINIPPSLARGFIEINNSCHRDCWFCGFNGIKRSSGCMGCNKWNEDGQPLSLDDWKRIIEELRDLDCRNLIITGGDLTLDWDRTMDILDFSYGLFPKIFMSFHQESISREIERDIANKATAIIQTEKLSDTLSDGSIYLLIANGSNGWKPNWIRKDNIIVDYIFKDQNHIPKDLPLMSKAKLSANMHFFLNNIRHHPCLGHTISICSDGKAIPCPMMRKYALGNVGKSPLYSIFQDFYLDKFWKLTLDKIDRCSSCEFRFACSDCRALEEALTGSHLGKRLCCYDPKIGEWQL
ncbi:radical SAM protein [Methanothrix soehngenii]|uniref:radical SAM protein n=1 Tax=Methanothrix soehngenii TaxID=2223 RepID=UPI003143343B